MNEDNRRLQTASRIRDLWYDNKGADARRRSELVTDLLAELEEEGVTVTMLRNWTIIHPKLARKDFTNYRSMMDVITDFLLGVDQVGERSKEYPLENAETAHRRKKARDKQEYGYRFIMEVKKIRDERYYKELGYSNFDDYCRDAWGVDRKYMSERISIAESFGSEKVSAIADSIGHKKSLLLSRMPEDQRQQAIDEGIPTKDGTKPIDEATQREISEYRKAKDQAEKRAEDFQKQAESEQRQRKPQKSSAWTAMQTNRQLRSDTGNLWRYFIRTEAATRTYSTL